MTGFKANKFTDILARLRRCFDVLARKHNVEKNNFVVRCLRSFQVHAGPKVSNSESSFRAHLL